MNEATAFMIFMALTTTSTNHQLARTGTYLADDVVRYSATQEVCDKEKGQFDSADGSCYLNLPQGRAISVSVLDKRIVVRVETKYDQKIMTDFTGVVVDQYRDSLVVQQAILRDPQAPVYGSDGMSLPVIERAGRDGCRMIIQFRADGKIDTMPSSRCDRRLAIAGAAKNS